MLSALLVAAALLLVPGVLVALTLGLRSWAAVAAAAPLSIAMTAGGAILLDLAGLPANGLLPAALTVAAAAVLVAVRRRHPSRRPAPRNLRRWAVPAAAALSGAVIAAQVLWSVGDAERISQTYDAVFHLNASAYVLDTGSGSSFDLYRITHPGEGVEFYPAAWHLLVALTAALSGASVPLATNAASVAVAAAVWVPGVVFLTDALFGRRSHRTVLLVCAALLASAFAGFPLLLLDWGTLYPTFLAYALMPSGLALVLLAVRPALLRGRENDGALSGWRVWTVAGAWAVAAGLSHPRSLFGLVVLAAPLVLAAAGSAGAAAWRRGGRDRRILLVAAAGTLLAGAGLIALGWAYVYRTFDVANRPISDHLNGGPALAATTVPQAALQALAQAPFTGAGTPTPPAWTLAAAVAVSAAALLWRPGARWLVAALASAALLYMLAAGSDSDLAKLATGLWYKDKYRLWALLPIVAAPIAAWGLAEAHRVLARRRGRGAAAAVTAVLAAAVLLPSWLTGPAAAVQGSIRATWSLPDSQKDGRLLDADQQTLLTRLHEHVPAGTVVAGNPWDGSGMSWALGGVPSLFPHLTGDWSAEQVVVAQRLDQAGVDPAVCDAVRALGVGGVLHDPERLWGGTDPAVDFYSGIDRAVASGVLTEVDREGSAALYRIPACPAGADAGSG